MTLTEIAMFKTFLKSKGMDEMFIGLYTKYKLKTNPVSIEQYLIGADAANVCMAAFYWIVNSRFGYDYWQDMQKKWDFYRKEKVALFPFNEIQKFKGSGKILRQNWDVAKYWHTEGRVETSGRYGIKLPEDELTAILEDRKICQDYENAALEERDKRQANKELLKRESEVEKEQESDALLEFEIIDITKVSKSVGRLKDNQFTLNVKNHGGRITMNRKISQDVLDRNFLYANIGRNKKGELMLMFNNKSGVNVHSGKGNATLCSKPLCDKISSILGIEENYVVLNANEIARTQEYIAYLITK